MNTKNNGCDHKRIDAFLDSDHVALEDPTLVDHLDTCAACRNYIETQAAEAERWAKATELLQPTEFDHAGTVGCSAATIGHQRVEQPVAVKHVLDALAPSDDPNRLGRLGGYEVSGVVGAGGMGVVLKAVDPALDRVVAIKVLAPHLAHSGTARRRFSREAKAAAAVLHPNVIPIHSVSSDEKIPYLVMAYIRGGSLQKRLDIEGPLSTVEILRIGSQVAAGLAAAHEQGLVHRDVKPENILLEEGVERITLTDFGLARAVDDASVTQPGTIAGTPQYMSPEQTRGEPIDQQSDLFSLGCVLYALCTGRPPFRADSSYAVMRQISDESPMPIRELNPEIPEWLCTTINKLMAKEKSKRFQSAHEVQEFLESCLGHVQHPATHPLPATLTPSLKRQLSPKTFIGVFAMLTLATAICLFWIPWNNVPLEAQAEGSTPIQQIAQLLAEWKESSPDAKQAQAYAKKIRVLTDELYEPLQPHTENYRRASQQLAVICWPYVLDAVPKTMAQVISTLTKPDAAVRASDRLADQGRPTEPLGWDIQATHALALARTGLIEQAIQENEALMKKLQINLMRGRLPDLEMEFLGANRTQKSLLKQTHLQQALILALADKIAESTDASTSAGAVDVSKPTKADLLAIQTLILKTVEAQTPARPDFSDGIEDATFVRKANNVHGETFYLRTEVARESLIANVRMHLGSHWRRRALKERDMLQAAVKGRQLPATVDLSVYENMNSPGMEVHIFFLTYKTKSHEPNVHINVFPASTRSPAAFAGKAADMRSAILSQMAASAEYAEALQQIKSIPRASLHYRVWDFSELPDDWPIGVDPTEFQKCNPLHDPPIRLVSFYEKSLSEDGRTRIRDPKKTKNVFVLIKVEPFEIVQVLEHTGTSGLNRTHYGVPPYANNLSAEFCLDLDQPDGTVTRYKVLPVGFERIEPAMEKQPLDAKLVVGTWRSVKLEGSDVGKRIVGVDAEFTEQGSVMMIAKMTQRDEVKSVVRKGEYKVALDALKMTFDDETRSCPAWFQGDRLVIQDPELDSRVHFERKTKKAWED